MFCRSNRISSRDSSHDGGSDQGNQSSTSSYFLKTEDQKHTPKRVKKLDAATCQQKILNSNENFISDKISTETFQQTPHYQIQDDLRNSKPFSGAIGSTNYNTNDTSCSRKKSLVETSGSHDITLWKRKRSPEEANLSNEEKRLKRLDRFAEVPKVQKEASVPVGLKHSNTVNLSLDEIIKKNKMQHKRRTNERPPEGHENVDEKLDNGDGIRPKQKEPVTQVPRRQISDDIPICSEEKKPGQLRPIVIDGSNVAGEYGSKDRFDCKGIQVCVNYFVQEGHKDITVVVPESYLEPHNLRIVNKDVLHQLKSKGHLMTCWSRQESKRKWVNCYDDRMILDIAHLKNGGIIVSNDKYRDLYKEYPNWRETIFSKLLPFRFIPGNPDDILLPQDPLGRYGPTLKEFLRYD